MRPTKHFHVPIATQNFESCVVGRFKTEIRKFEFDERRFLAAVDITSEVARQDVPTS